MRLWVRTLNVGAKHVVRKGDIRAVLLTHSDLGQAVSLLRASASSIKQTGPLPPSARGRIKQSGVPGHHGGSIKASCNYSFYCYSPSPGDWGSVPAAACQTARDLDQKGHSPPFQLNARTAGYLPSLRPPKSSDPRSWRARSPSRWPAVSQNSSLATASPPYLLPLSIPISGTAPPSTPPPAGDWTLSWTPDPSSPKARQSPCPVKSASRTSLKSILSLPSREPLSALVWPSSSPAQVPAPASSSKDSLGVFSPPLPLGSITT